MTTGSDGEKKQKGRRSSVMLLLALALAIGIMLPSKEAHAQCCNITATIVGNTASQPTFIQQLTSLGGILGAVGNVLGFLQNILGPATAAQTAAINANGWITNDTLHNLGDHIGDNNQFIMGQNHTAQFQAAATLPNQDSTCQRGQAEQAMDQLGEGLGYMSGAETALIEAGDCKGIYADCSGTARVVEKVYNLCQLGFLPPGSAGSPGPYGDMTTTQLSCPQAQDVSYINRHKIPFGDFYQMPLAQACVLPDGYPYFASTLPPGATCQNGTSSATPSYTANDPSQSQLAWVGAFEFCENLGADPTTPVTTMGRTPTPLDLKQVAEDDSMTGLSIGLRHQCLHYLWERTACPSSNPSVAQALSGGGGNDNCAQYQLNLCYALGNPVNPNGTADPGGTTGTPIYAPSVAVGAGSAGLGISSDPYLNNCLNNGTGLSLLMAESILAHECKDFTALGQGLPTMSNNTLEANHTAKFSCAQIRDNFDQKMEEERQDITDMLYKSYEMRAMAVSSNTSFRASFQHGPRPVPVTMNAGENNLDIIRLTQESGMTTGSDGEKKQKGRRSSVMLLLALALAIGIVIPAREAQAVVCCPNPQVTIIADTTSQPTFIQQLTSLGGILGTIGNVLGWFQNLFGPATAAQTAAINANGWITNDTLHNLGDHIGDNNQFIMGQNHTAQFQAAATLPNQDSTCQRGQAEQAMDQLGEGLGYMSGAETALIEAGDCKGIYADCSGTARVVEKVYNLCQLGFLPPGSTGSPGPYGDMTTTQLSCPQAQDVSYINRHKIPFGDFYQMPLAQACVLPDGYPYFASTLPPGATCQNGTSSATPSYTANDPSQSQLAWVGAFEFCENLGADPTTPVTTMGRTPTPLDLKQVAEDDSMTGLSIGLRHQCLHYLWERTACPSSNPSVAQALSGGGGNDNCAQYQLNLCYALGNPVNPNGTADPGGTTGTPIYAPSVAVGAGSAGLGISSDPYLNNCLNNGTGLSLLMAESILAHECKDFTALGQGLPTMSNNTLEANHTAKFSCAQIRDNFDQKIRKEEKAITNMLYESWKMRALASSSNTSSAHPSNMGPARSQ